MTNQNATKKTITGECGKCSGIGYIKAFSHVQRGVCFACEGTGQHTGRYYAEGLVYDHGQICWSFGHGGSLILSGGRHSEFGGIISMSRKQALQCIKNELNAAHDSPRHLFSCALRLAALGDEHAVERAAKYLGELGPSLLAAMPEARKAIHTATPPAKEDFGPSLDQAKAALDGG
jgi:hypothetical protein